MHVPKSSPNYANPAGETFITGINQYITSQYLNGTFRSCAQVSVPSTGQLAFDVMCGDWGASRCSPTRWFEYMGDRDTPFVPFQINYLQFDETAIGVRPPNGYVPHNPRTVPCNQAPNVSATVDLTEQLLSKRCICFVSTIGQNAGLLVRRL